MDSEEALLRYTSDLRPYGCMVISWWGVFWYAMDNWCLASLPDVYADYQTHYGEPNLSAVMYLGRDAVFLDRHDHSPPDSFNANQPVLRELKPTATGRLVTLSHPAREK